MTFTCIGQHKISNRRNERSQLIRCTATSEVPSIPGREDLGWLCESCSSELPHGRPQYEEDTNVGATQADPLEFKDQIASGFASGARRIYQDEGDNND
jgi:hypothetical protein